MQKIKVSVFNTDHAKSVGMKKALEGQAQLELYEVTREKEMVPHLVSTQPHIVLLSIDVQDELFDKLIKHNGANIILIANDDIYETKKIVRAIQLGVSGYINIHSYEGYDITPLVKKMERIHKQPTKETKRPNNQKKIMKKASDVNVLAETYVPQRARHQDTIVAIGTSTGGPRALETVVRNLPKDFNVPIVVVQHMPAKFTKSLAERLNRLHKMKVKEAVDQETVENGTIYIAPGNFHMEIKKKHHKLVIHLHQNEVPSPHRPSVDVLFDSVSDIRSMNKIAVILTGMGKDGSAGIRKMKQLDPHTVVIVESKETAVVDGMTSAAIATNHVTEVVRIEAISNTIMKYVT